MAKQMSTAITWSSTRSQFGTSTQRSCTAWASTTTSWLTSSRDWIRNSPDQPRQVSYRGYLREENERDGRARGSAASEEQVDKGNLVRLAVDERGAADAAIRSEERRVGKERRARW